MVELAALVPVICTFTLSSLSVGHITARALVYAEFPISRRFFPEWTVAATVFTATLNRGKM